MTNKITLQEVVDGYRELIKNLPTPRQIIITSRQSKPCGPPHLPQVEVVEMIFADYPTNIL